MIVHTEEQTKDFSSLSSERPTRKIARVIARCIVLILSFVVIGIVEMTAEAFGISSNLGHVWAGFMICWMYVTIFPSVMPRTSK